MIQPRVATPNAAIAAHYDDLAPFYLRMWGEYIHHGYWLGGGESHVEVRDISRHVNRTSTLSMLRSARATVTDREFRSQLFDPTFTNRAFAWTMFRFVAAYRTGALRHAIVSATKR